MQGVERNKNAGIGLTYNLFRCYNNRVGRPFGRPGFLMQNGELRCPQSGRFQYAGDSAEFPAALPSFAVGAGNARPRATITPGWFLLPFGQFTSWPPLRILTHLHPVCIPPARLWASHPPLGKGGFGSIKNPPERNLPGGFFYMTLRYSMEVMVPSWTRKISCEPSAS